MCDAGGTNAGVKKGDGADVSSCVLANGLGKGCGAGADVWGTANGSTHHMI